MKRKKRLILLIPAIFIILILIMCLCVSSYKAPYINVTLYSKSQSTVSCAKYNDKIYYESSYITPNLINDTSAFKNGRFNIPLQYSYKPVDYNKILFAKYDGKSFFEWFDNVFAQRVYTFENDDEIEAFYISSSTAGRSEFIYFREDFKFPTIYNKKINSFIIEDIDEGTALFTIDDSNVIDMFINSISSQEDLSELFYQQCDNSYNNIRFVAVYEDSAFNETIGFIRNNTFSYFEKMGDSSMS